MSPEPNRKEHDMSNTTINPATINYALSTMSVDAQGDAAWLDRVTDRIAERLSAAFPESVVRVTLNRRDSQSRLEITYNSDETVGAWDGEAPDFDEEGDRARAEHEIEQAFNGTI